MDIKIVPAEKAKDGCKYPYVGITEDGETVLFTAPDTGVVLKGVGEMGDYSEDWGEKAFFKPFHGTITITCP